MFRDHILHPNQPGIFCARVVDEALTQVFADVRAVVVCFHEAADAGAGFTGVDVQGVEKFANVVEWFEFLRDDHGQVDSVSTGTGTWEFLLGWSWIRSRHFVSRLRH